MNLRIITWNVSFKCNAEKVAEYLTKNISGHTIINLQEVLEPAHSKIVSILKRFENTGAVGHISPLAVSHVISKRFKRRYDHIYCSDKWTIKDVQYPFENSVEASSDHSAVIGDFKLPNL